VVGTSEVELLVVPGFCVVIEGELVSTVGGGTLADEYAEVTLELGVDGS